ncbi:DNA starvation/stationary phase protection protein Dps [Alicyclobacillus sp. SO9]|uniref:DNA starvation/stationary phase protection protein Dps n=1 Tax=Alicyclobacillus sp. SO9 TaxID=2665646 RepID=UPI0018E8EA0A|nr:DNA starvation/stationary phase protection protein Dps [Alicyclobacillus sp. SO9]QQE79350.1 DNA starvation/stationary phase protection protein Dps [Alicyclobacillus sp. SO9]
MNQTATAARLSNTRISLQSQTKEQMVRILNQHVTDLTDLFVQSKLAHWNVRGAHFISYHKLFDELAGHLTELTDTVAERVTALGGTAGVPVQSIAAQTSVAQWPLDQHQDVDVIKALAERWAVVANSARQAVVDTAQADPDTSDLFTEVSRQLDKDLWFLEAHFEM